MKKGSTKRGEENGYRLFGCRLFHFSASVGLFFVFFLLFRYGSLTAADGGNLRSVCLPAMGYACLLGFFNRTYHAHLLGHARVRDLVFGQFVSQLFSLILIYGLLSLRWNRLADPTAFLPLLGLQLALDAGWSYLASAYYCRLHGTRRTLLIYRNQLDRLRFGSLRGKPAERLYAVTDELQFDGEFAELREHLRGYDAIFAAGINSACRNGILKYCMEENVPGFFLPHVGDLIMQEAVHAPSFDAPVLYVSRKSLTPEYALLKRAFDLLASGIVLFLVSPLLLFTALAIKLCDGGPVFYRQTRLTRDGRPFQMLKFRSMRVDAERDGRARLCAGEEDERITPVGKWVRRYRLDELPQLINIFAGDMSVVGPRPERPEIARRYEETVPDFRLRLQVKAGLTGYAQVYGKYDTAPYEKLEFDLMYIRRMSPLTDLRLCFATLAVLFRKDGAQGAPAAAEGRRQVAEGER